MQGLNPAVALWPNDLTSIGLGQLKAILCAGLEMSDGPVAKWQSEILGMSGSNHFMLW